MQVPSSIQASNNVQSMRRDETSQSVLMSVFEIGHSRIQVALDIRVSPYKFGMITTKVLVGMTLGL